MADQLLITFYSRTGNTEKIAGMIHHQVGGALHQILSETPYPDSYQDTVNQAKEEIKRGFRPPLKNVFDQISGFDLIFIGSPNWWSTIAPPVARFLSEHDFSGKSLALFCTHGGGGIGRMLGDIADLCPESSILKPLSVYSNGGNTGEAEVAAWLKEINPDR